MTTISGSWRRGLVIAAVSIVGALAGASWRPAAAQATGKTAPPPSSIAIVDLAKVSAALKEGEVMRARLEEQKTAYTKRLEQIKNSLETTVADLEMLKDKRDSPEFLAKLAEKFELEATGKARRETLQQLIDLSEGESLRAMYLKIVDTCNKIGTEAGYDLILVDDQYMLPRPNKPGAQVAADIRDRRILYASPRVDITQQVITKMNNEFMAATGKKN